MGSRPRALGIPALKEEQATNASVGFTARFGDFSATVDRFIVDVNERIVLTGDFEEDDEDIGEELQRLNSALRLNHFGRIVLIGWLDEEDVYEAKTTTDLSFSYRPSSVMTITWAVPMRR